MPPQSWTCKHEGCGASWTRESETWIAGTRQKCTTCGNDSTVGLSCPSCKTELETPDGFLGGRRFRCTCGHVFQIPLSRREVVGRLTAMGSLVSEFNQTERMKLLPGDLRSRVSDGFCKGVCYDWIRRVTQGGAASYADAATTATAAPEAERGAQAWVVRYKEDLALFKAAEESSWKTSTKIDALKRSDVQLRRTQVAIDRRKAELAAAYKRNLASYESIRKTYNACATAEAQTAMSPSLMSAKRVMDESYTAFNDCRVQLEALIAEINATVKKIDAANEARAETVSQAIISRYYPTFAAKMDEFAAGHTRLRRMSTVQRPFRGMEALSVMKTAEYTSTAVMMTSLVGHDDLQSNCGAVFGFDKWEGDSGHAVATQRQADGKYYLFDPNFGVFSMTAAKLIEAITLLFETYYAGYERDGRFKGDFEIFGRKTTAINTVQVPRPEKAIAEAPVVLRPARNVAGPGKRVPSPGAAVGRPGVVPNSAAAKPSVPKPSSKRTPAATGSRVKDRVAKWPPGS